MQKSEDKKKSHGGARKGAGRHAIFQEPTTINFKCELSDKLAAKEKYGKGLNQKFIKWLKSII